jgi:acyl dehydratase
VSVRFDSPQALVDAGGDVALGETPWVEIDQETIDRFADATDDHQWIHTDPIRAATGPFGATIAHGYLTLSLVPRFLSELLDVGGTALAINAGSDRVRFVQPVLVGSRLRASAVLVSAEPSGPGVRAVVRVTVSIEGQDRPALVADTLTIYVPA